MDWRSVSSSTLVAVAYDAETSNLYIEFKGGIRYVYYNVPKSIYSGLMSAASHGGYHAAHIKTSYRYQKL